MVGESTGNVIPSGSAGSTGAPGNSDASSKCCREEYPSTAHGNDSFGNELSCSIAVII
jgi:hypothetical protein